MINFLILNIKQCMFKKMLCLTLFHLDCQKLLCFCLKMKETLSLMHLNKAQRLLAMHCDCPMSKEVCYKGTALYYSTVQSL